MAEIEGLVQRASQIHYYLRWDGYDRVYNTFELAANIVDKQLLADFHKARSPELMQAEFDVREQVAAGMLKMRRGQVDFTVEVPASAGGGAKLLDLWSRPPSRAGKAPVELSVTETESTRTTELQLDLLDDLAWVLKLELVRSEQAFGCVVFKRGKGSNHGMLVFGPPFTAWLVEPLPRADGVFVPGKHCFGVMGNLWMVNGYYGSLDDLPGAPNLTMRKPIAEHVKSVLRGRQPWGVKHKLTHKWAQLPKGKSELKGAAAMPMRRGAKRARAPPLNAGDEKPRMRALQ